MGFADISKEIYNISTLGSRDLTNSEKSGKK